MKISFSGLFKNFPMNANNRFTLQNLNRKFTSVISRDSSEDDSRNLSWKYLFLQEIIHLFFTYLNQIFCLRIIQDPDSPLTQELTYKVVYLYKLHLTRTTCQIEWQVSSYKTLHSEFICLELFQSVYRYKASRINS